MNESTKINDEYKDRLFNFIFGSEAHKDWTLSLYNAVNGSDYTDPSMIEFNTLKDALYLGMRNDTSFLVSDLMSVYEHQSTYNPNMPLRLLQYVGDLYAGYLSKNKYNKYGKTLIKLPTPKLVTFYNGTDNIEESSTLRLSDSFTEENRNKSDIEVKVRMINVNYGKNKDIMEKCEPLCEYAWLINEIRKNQQDGYILSKAVNLSIEHMSDEFLIKDYLVMNKQEVQGMIDTEYNEAEAMELFKNEGREEATDKVNRLNSILISAGRLDDLKRSTEDKSFQKQLMDELL